jgi:hypothetical protein
MQRSGPIELSQHADWSTWRDVKVPLDQPASAEWLVRVESSFRHGLRGFQSMEFEPGRPMLALVINEPEDDADALTTAVDSCLAAAAPSGR